MVGASLARRLTQQLLRRIEEPTSPETGPLTAATLPIFRACRPDVVRNVVAAGFALLDRLHTVGPFPTWSIVVSVVPQHGARKAWADIWRAGLRIGHAGRLGQARQAALAAEPVYCVVHLRDQRCCRREADEADIEGDRVPVFGKAERCLGMAGTVGIEMVDLNQGRFESAALELLEQCLAG